jgi:hypothetical protein
MYRGDFHTFKDAHFSEPNPTEAFNRRWLARKCPPGFIHNKGQHFVDFFITTPDGITQQAAYVKVILGIMPIVMGLLVDSDKVFTKPLYADPVWPFSRRPIYTPEEMASLEYEYREREHIDGCVATIRDLSLEAELHRFRMLTAQAAMMNTRLREIENVWGTVDVARLACVRRLEMADTLGRIDDVKEHTISRVIPEPRGWAEVVRRGLRT